MQRIVIETHDLNKPEGQDHIETKETVYGSHRSKLWLGGYIMWAIMRGYSVLIFSKVDESKFENV